MGFFLINCNCCMAAYFCKVKLNKRAEQPKLDFTAGHDGGETLSDRWEETC